MNSLRQEAKRQGRTAVKEADLFARLFMKVARNFGRSHEMLLMGLFNLFSLRFLQDIHYAPGMYLKGKIHLLPQRVKDRAALRELIDPYIGKGKKRGDRG
jgi:heterodisulfide reductase subunit C